MPPYPFNAGEELPAADLNAAIAAAMASPASTGGTVTSVGTGAGLTGGPIISTGTIIANWQANTVTTIGSGLTLAGGTLSATGSGGTVTSVTPGTGLSGAAITSTGTINADSQTTQTVSTSTATVTPASGTTSVVVTLQANTTLTVAAGTYGGQHFRLELLQDGTGSRTVAFDASVEYGTDITSFTATATANRRDLIQLIWNSAAAKWMVAAVNHGFA